MKEGDSMDMGKTDEQAFRVAYLIGEFVRQNLTEQEEQELDEWIAASMENQRLFEELTDPDNLDNYIKWKEKLPAAETLSRLQSKLEFSDANKKKSVFRSIWPYVAAAIIIAGAAIALNWIPGKTKPANKVESLAKDIAPGGNRATLTLSDGRKIALDTAAAGVLAQQENASIQKDDSALISYKVISPIITAGNETMNTITTPSGGTYSLILGDGSKVVLNANSSLRFPTAFSGKKRSVSLTGEGYFEVAKDPKFPFEVVASGNKVTVLGTHFNINSYGDEPFLKVTLEEGAVRLNNTTLLKPGQQAQVNADKAVTVVPADLEMELAWKNGLFIFKHAQLDEVMRQAGRWYNCEVVFDTKNTEHFNFTVPRNVPVSKLLGYLEAAGGIHFNVASNKITVMP